MRFTKALIICIIIFSSFVVYTKDKKPLKNILHVTGFIDRKADNKNILSDNTDEVNNGTSSGLPNIAKENTDIVVNVSSRYKECILFTSKTYKSGLIDQLMKYANSKSNSFFKLCENIYLIIPITESIKDDSNYMNIRIIRILYPKPELFSILLPLNTDFNKDEILVVEIKEYEIKKIEKSVKEYTKNMKMTLLDSTEIKLKEYSLHQLRYFWLYLGLEFVEQHIKEIQSYTTEKLSKMFKKYEKPLKDTRCLSNYKNEDMSLIIRFFRRWNTKSYINEINEFDDSLKVISIIQNQMLINPYKEMKDLLSNSKRELNYFWCSNWNSVFFLSRLLPLLYYNKYTMWCDDDEIFSSKMSNQMKYISNKYNALLGSHGIRSQRVINIKYKNEEYPFKYAYQVYGSSFFQSRWQVNLWRFRSYYKLWGDDIITELISQYECNMNQLLTINNTKILIGLKSFGVSTNMQNASMYRKGHQIMDGIIRKCTRNREAGNKIENRNKCFYEAYI